MQSLFLAYSLSGAAGVRSSWVMLVISILVKVGYIHPGASLAWMGTWWVIALALVASIVDFIGDKVPVLDHLLHIVHIGLAPVVGALSAMTGYHGDPTAMLILGLLGGGNALALHSARSGLRAVSTATTMGFGNIVISIIEDVLVTCFIIVAVLAPFLTAALMVISTVWVFRKIGAAASARRSNVA